MNPSQVPRILLVDDHPLMRTGLRQVLGRVLPLAEFGEAGNGVEAVKAMSGARWNLVLLDLELPDRSGLDVLADLKLAAPGVPVLVVSGLSETEFGLRAMTSGAAGFIAKTELTTTLAEAVRKVLSGGRYVSPVLGERLARTLTVAGSRSGEPHETLSAREFQILVQIGRGQTVGEIAAQLSLSIKTVSTYRTRLLRKMMMKSNAELMRYAWLHQLTR